MLLRDAGAASLLVRHYSYPSQPTDYPTGSVHTHDAVAFPVTRTHESEAMAPVCKTYASFLFLTRPARPAFALPGRSLIHSATLAVGDETVQDEIYLRRLRGRRVRGWYLIHSAGAVRSS